MTILQVQIGDDLMNQIVAAVIAQLAANAKPAEPKPEPEPAVNATTLWHAGDIAEYLGKSRETVTDTISKGVSFPAPVALPPTKGARRSHSRWYAVEVIEWARKTQKPKRSKK